MMVTIFFLGMSIFSVLLTHAAENDKTLKQIQIELEKISERLK